MNAPAEWLALLGVALAGLSGAPGLFGERRAVTGERIAAVLMTLAAVSGVASAALALARPSDGIDLGWHVPGGALTVRVDAISAMFLLQIFVIVVLGAIYGLGYWPQRDHPENGRKLRLFYGLLTAGMALLVVARNAMLFLAGWEVMALAAFFVITTEDHERGGPRGRLRLPRRDARRHALPLRDVRAAPCGDRHASTLVRAAVDAAWRTRSSSLGLVGFGLKAGVMPLHVWLPGAHAERAEPRVGGDVGRAHQDGHLRPVRASRRCSRIRRCGGAVSCSVLGVVSGVLGVAFAIGQHDLKRLLAYHSVENIGIICMGLGLALLGRVARPQRAGRARPRRRAPARLEPRAVQGAPVPRRRLGAARARARGRSISSAASRRPMPSTAARLPGRCGRHLRPAAAQRLRQRAVDLPRPVPRPSSQRPAACGWPVPSPRQRSRSSARSPWPASSRCSARFSWASRARIGRGRRTRAAASCSARWPRSPPSASSSARARRLLAPVLDRAVSAWAPEWSQQRRALVALAPLSLRLARGRGAGRRARPLRAASSPAGSRPSAPAVVTWDCGYAAPSPRMQYTSSSFAEMLVGLFRWALRPQAHRPHLRGIFPAGDRFHSHVPDAVLDRDRSPRRPAIVGRGLSVAALAPARQRAALPALHPDHACRCCSS